MGAMRSVVLTPKGGFGAIARPPVPEALMTRDDMILVSVDDHVIEPPTIFQNHVPKKPCTARSAE